MKHVNSVLPGLFLLINSVQKSVILVDEACKFCFSCRFICMFSCYVVGLYACSHVKL